MSPQEKEDIKFIVRKFIQEYEIWGLKINISKAEYHCNRCIGQEVAIIDLEKKATKAVEHLSILC